MTTAADPRAPLSLREILRRHERVVIIHTLQAYGGSRARAAQALQLSPCQLWRRMRALGMDFAALPAARTGRPRKTEEQASGPGQDRI